MVVTNENVSSIDHASGIQLPDGFKLSINQKNKQTMTSQFADMTLSSIFLTLPCFSCQVQLLVQVSCHYHDWLWSYDNFRLKRIDQKSRNRKYPLLSFAQYPAEGGGGAGKNTPTKIRVKRILFSQKPIGVYQKAVMMQLFSKNSETLLQASNH